MFRRASLLLAFFATWFITAALALTPGQRIVLFSGIRPIFFENFLTESALSANFTASGGVNGSAFNSNGLVIDGVSAPRFSYTQSSSPCGRYGTVACSVFAANKLNYSNSTGLAWSAAPSYTYIYAFDTALAFTNVPNYFSSSQVYNNYHNFIGAKDGSGNLPIAITTAAAGQYYYSGKDYIHWHTGGDPIFWLPVLMQQYYNETGLTTTFTADLAVMKAALQAVPRDSGNNLVSAGSTASFTGTISATTLTVTGSVTGTIQIPSGISGALIPGATTISAQLTGTPGGDGTYTVSQSLTVSSPETMASVQSWVSTGFQDGVQKTGDDCMGSALMYQAEIAIAANYTANSDSTNAALFTADAAAIKAGFPNLWDSTDGMFYAATGQNQQIDVNCSAFAIYIGLTSAGEATSIEAYLVANESTLFNSAAYVLQTPSNWAFLWSGGSPYDNYYWSWGNYWVVTAIAKANKSLAFTLANTFNSASGTDHEYFITTTPSGAANNIESPTWLLRFTADNTLNFYPQSNALGLLVEAAGTNLAHFSENPGSDFTANTPTAGQYGAYSTSITMPANGFIAGPNGVAGSMQQVSFNSTAGTPTFGQRVTTVASVTYNYCLWMATASGTFNLKMSRTNSLAWLNSISPVITVTTTPTRSCLQYTTGVGTVSDLLIGAEAFTPYALPATGSVYVWGFSNVAESAQTSYVGPTSAGSLTRTADSISLTGRAAALAALGPSQLKSMNEFTQVVACTTYAAGAFPATLPAGFYHQRLEIFAPGTATSRVPC
jgi:hypothetical protein